MHILQGHFQAIGVKGHYLCLGAIPLDIKFWGLEGATPDTVEWNSSMIHDILTVEGAMRPTAGGAVVDYAFGEGVSPYYGGDTMSSVNQTDLTYGGGIYVKRDDKDYRHYTNTAAGLLGDASTVTIDTWTLDTAGTPSGHFNGDVVGTYISKGSLIRIQATDVPNRVYTAAITNTPAASGGVANEIYLSWAVPNGKVSFIGGYAGYKPIPLGEVTEPGMVLNLATTPFVNGEMVGFRALMP